MKAILVLFGFIFSLSALSEQKSTISPALRQLFHYAKNINVFNNLLPQEKVYLHFDNTGYFKGETIWFKAYVVRTDSMSHTNLSKVLYVDFLTPMGELLERKKLPIVNGQANSEFQLDKILDSGFYEVKAYTRYMINWDKDCLFSRVLPIFKEPSKAGDYSQAVIDRNTFRYRDSDFEPRDSVGRGKLQVGFYPEGGGLVKGLMSRVAFDVSYEREGAFDTEGFLCNERGDTLTEVKTFREGRGLFNYLPEATKVDLVIKDRKGHMRRFPLPEASDTGRVMTLDVLTKDNIRIEVRSSPSLFGDTLGLTLMNNGNVYSFDTIVDSSTSRVLAYSRDGLPAGVNQVTLFDRSGRIWSERLFFIMPDSSDFGQQIEISSPKRDIAPYAKINLNTTSVPGNTFSLSVVDADTRTNGYRGNVKTWLLLSSDLKGFIRNPAYYFESDDPEHRMAADLLTMVQGWRRYEWVAMAGKKTFEKKQPIEDGLYVDGQVKATRDDLELGKTNLTTVMFGKKGGVLYGTAATDEKGYYSFSVPECYGEWKLIINTKKDDDAQKSRISINRNFSQGKKIFSYYETELEAPDSATLHFNAEKDIYAEAEKKIEKMLERDILLKSAKVVKKRKNHWTDNARASWVDEKIGAHHSTLYYNCDEFAEKIADEGGEIPFFRDWLENICPIFNQMQDSRAILFIVNNEFKYVKYPTSRTLFMDNENWTVLKNGLTQLWPDYLDECKSVYVSQDVNLWKRYLSTGGSVSGNTEDDEEEEEELKKGGKTLMSLDEREELRRMSKGEVDLERLSPICVFVYPRLSVGRKAKGLRRTNFQGYNQPQTFEMNNYDKLPQEVDYRRTLYWNPNVKPNKEGKAVLEFWNNSTCRKIYISAEGITKDGTPKTYQQQNKNTNEQIK